jgi:hypothetical protein
MSARGMASILLVALFLAGCSKRAEVRYRLHVVLDDNGAERSGDGVWSVTEYGAKFAGYSGSLNGDAVPVQLPHRGILLVLPAGASERLGDVAFMLPERVLGHDVSASFEGRIATLARISKTYAAPKAVPCDYSVNNDPTIHGPLGREQFARSANCLKLAYTDSPRDPTHLHTLDRLDGLGIPRGVKVTEITIQVTRDPVNRDLDRTLPWLTGEPFKRSGIYVAGRGEPGIGWYAQYLRRGH